jgi:hypothetical protein
MNFGCNTGSVGDRRLSFTSHVHLLDVTLFACWGGRGGKVISP